MRSLRLLLFAGALAAVAALPASSSGVVTKATFSTPRYIDMELAGGEPEVLADTMHGTLVYTSHEGTTHLYRGGIVSSPWGDFSFVSNYCNQVNVWYSADGGVNWFRDSYLGTQCPANPTYTGFSDPDLTIDAEGRIYNTGINLVNDSLFASKDGGRTWKQGTPYCHNGDRPWLAGGRADEVFMGTDPLEDVLDHEVYRSGDGGQTCSQQGIPDFGTDRGMHYTGFGKLYFDKDKMRLAEPTVYTDEDGNTVGLGVSTWKRGDARFTPHFVASTPGFVGFFPVIAVDRGNTIYLVWTPDLRQAGTHGGCDGAETPAPNPVRLTWSTDWGKTWASPITLWRPSNARVFWPWITAGDAGKISVVWYQTEPGELADLDCQKAHVHIYEAHILNATSSTRTKTVVDAAGRVIHFNTVCQGGTLCVVSGKDRRLGDFFTNSLDARGCVLIASGDTMLKDPTTGADLPTSRPIIMRQVTGPALRGTGTCT